MPSLSWPASYLDMPGHVIGPFQGVREHLAVPLHGYDFCQASGKRERKGVVKKERRALRVW